MTRNTADQAARNLGHRPVWAPIAMMGDVANGRAHCQHCGVALTLDNGAIKGPAITVVCNGLDSKVQDYLKNRLSVLSNRENFDSCTVYSVAGQCCVQLIDGAARLWENDHVAARANLTEVRAAVVEACEDFYFG